MKFGHLGIWFMHAVYLRLLGRHSICVYWKYLHQLRIPFIKNLLWMMELMENWFLEVVWRMWMTKYKVRVIRNLQSLLKIWYRHLTKTRIDALQLCRYLFNFLKLLEVLLTTCTENVAWAAQNQKLIGQLNFLEQAWGLHKLHWNQNSNHQRTTNKSEKSYLSICFGTKTIQSERIVNL